MRNFKNRWDWHVAMSEVINASLTKCFPRNWDDEDHITRTILTSLRDRFSSSEIESDKIRGKNIRCSWDVYKNTKKMGLEQLHGDIGILVKLEFESGKTLEGVAFVEAKRVYHHDTDDSKSKYEALDWPQLARVSENSSFHRTLLYDYVTHTEEQVPLALTLPTRHLIALNDNSRNILKHCEHFSYCLTNRYLQGYELDYDPLKVEAVKGFIDVKGGVDYLLVSHVTLPPELQPSLDSVLINREIYQKLETPRPEPTSGMRPG